MINVGIAGIGFMGWIHWLAYQKVRGARVAAICEFDKKKLTGDWRAIKGNFGPPGEMVDLSGIDTHSQIVRLIAAALVCPAKGSNVTLQRQRQF